VLVTEQMEGLVVKRELQDDEWESQSEVFKQDYDHRCRSLFPSTYNMPHYPLELPYPPTSHNSRPVAPASHDHRTTGEYVRSLKSEKPRFHYGNDLFADKEKEFREALNIELRKRGAAVAEYHRNYILSKPPTIPPPQESNRDNPLNLVRTMPPSALEDLSFFHHMMIQKQLSPKRTEETNPYYNLHAYSLPRPPAPTIQPSDNPTRTRSSPVQNLIQPFPVRPRPADNGWPRSFLPYAARGHSLATTGP